jgi:hypothetical protein
MVVLGTIEAAAKKVVQIAMTLVDDERPGDGPDA